MGARAKEIKMTGEYQGDKDNNTHKILDLLLVQKIFIFSVSYLRDQHQK
jgi:hypothetical protein